MDSNPNQPSLCSIFHDERGILQFIPVHPNISQQFISKNKKNVIRGIHTSPYGKWITCLEGSFIDYIIDFDTMTYKKFILSKDTINHVYVPPNHGHCFVALEDNSVMLYQLEGVFDATKDKNYHYRCPYIQLDIPEGDYILSEKDSQNPFYKPIDYVILGHRGFLGGETYRCLKEQGKNVIALSTRLEQTDILRKQLLLYRPKYIISAAGISGKPTVQWCETHRIETVSTNITYQLTLVQLCHELGIHLTLYLSGLIYNYREDHLYTEEDEPNKTDLYYSQCRALLEKAIAPYPNVLGLRIIYPMSLNGHPKCFMEKTLSRCKTLHNVPLNITYLPDLLPKLPILIERGTTGIFNFINKGSIMMADMMNMYKKYKPSFEYNLIEIMPTVGLLNTDKLGSIIQTYPIHTCLETGFQNNI